jgi:hypothetical protein
VHRTQPPKEKDQRFVRDTVLQGFALRAVKDEYLAVRKGLRPKTIGDYGSTQGPVTSKFTAFWTTCSIPGCLIGFHGSITRSTTIAMKFTADRRGRTA